jgi:hypothetical protein
VLADGVVLDANYALQTRAADQPTLGRRGGGASSARARQGPLRLRYDGKSKVTGRKGKNSFAYGYIRNVLGQRT